MKYTIEVENIKCGGCANSIGKTITNYLKEAKVDINVEEGIISIDCAKRLDLTKIKEALLKMGYPEKGSLGGLKAATAQAKSFVSCALGKTNKNKHISGQKQV